MYFYPYHLCLNLLIQEVTQRQSRHPDWAIVFKGQKKIYFVAETESEGQELLKSEKLKIKCGKAHFKKFDDVVYRQVTTVKDLSE